MKFIKFLRREKYCSVSCLKNVLYVIVIVSIFSRVFLSFCLEFIKNIYVDDKDIESKINDCSLTFFKYKSDYKGRLDKEEAIIGGNEVC